MSKYDYRKVSDLVPPNPMCECVFGVRAMCDCVIVCNSVYAEKKGIVGGMRRRQK